MQTASCFITVRVIWLLHHNPMHVASGDCQSDATREGWSHVCNSLHAEALPCSLFQQNLFHSNFCSKRCPLFALCCRRQSRALDHCQQMLCSATAGLEGYCPVCLLPCLTPRYATRQDHTLPVHSRDRTSLQNSQHRQGCSGIGEHISDSQSVNSRQQQPHGAQLLKAQQQGEPQLPAAEQSVGHQGRWLPVGTKGAADCVGSGHGEANDELLSQGNDNGTLTRELVVQLQQQQQQQLQKQNGTPVSDVEAAKAGKEMAEAWVSYLPIASQTMCCLLCMWQLQAHCLTHNCSFAYCTFVQDKQPLIRHAKRCIVAHVCQLLSP